MASTYTSLYFTAGRRAGSIKQIINYANCNKIEENLSTPAEPFIITGGNPTIEYSNGYYTITFLDNGNINFLVPLTLDYDDFRVLVVGGGGGGGSGGLNGEGFFFGATLGGGGGGGGEVLYQGTTVLQDVNYDIIIGKGGSSSKLGESSSFSTIIAKGGNPGSDATSTNPGERGYGKNDNDGGFGGYRVSAGDGYYYQNPQNGNNGIPIMINLSMKYYGGGGGGGSYSYQNQNSVGGLGGGGSGLYPNDGILNTGGGGGGNGDPNNLSQGGRGGSGIVTISFKYIPTNATNVNTSCKTCVCPSPINTKIVNNSNPDVIPGKTQVERAVNAIRYGRGGKIIYGNAAYQSDGYTLLGRLQGRPLPAFLSRNKF
jgi:hypothetical protein